MRYVSPLGVKTALFFLGLPLALMLTGCGFLPEPVSEPSVNVEEISITLDSDANLNSATAVDVVVIYRADVFRALLKMTASEYFASADQIKRDYPDVVDVFHWELTPGQRVRNVPVDFRGESPAGAIVFANYLTPGAHRVRLGTQDQAHIHLRKYEFCVLEQGCGPLRLFDDSPDEVVVRGQLTPRKPIPDSYFEETVLPRISPASDEPTSALKSKGADALNRATGSKAGTVIKDAMQNHQAGQTSLNADHE